MSRDVSYTASVSSGHAPVEKHKSGEDYVVVMLGILGKVFLSDLLPRYTVKIPFVSAKNFCLCQGEFGVESKSKTSSRNPQRVKLLQRGDEICVAAASVGLCPYNSPCTRVSGAVLINHRYWVIRGVACESWLLYFFQSGAAKRQQGRSVCGSGARAL